MSGGAKPLIDQVLPVQTSAQFPNNKYVVGEVCGKDIYWSILDMKEIQAGGGYLFDVLYMGRDPVPLAGENGGTTQTEFKPVEKPRRCS